MDRLISEQAVIESIEFFQMNPQHFNFVNLIDDIKEIPSAEPQTVLYSGDGYADGYMVYDMAECPNCGYEYEDGDKDWGLPFCPNCGQKLNWKRSDKE